VAFRRAPLLRACLLCAVLALLSACGQDQAAAPAGDGAAAQDPPAQDPAGAADAVADGNLRDGCVDDVPAEADLFPDKVTVEYAQSFAVDYHGSYKTVEVRAPDVEEPIRYVLVQCGAQPPALEGDLADSQVIDVPVMSVVSLTTTNLPHFDELDAVDRLEGVGTGAFVSTPSVLERVEAGELEDYADSAGQPDLERLIGADPDLLIVDGFGDTLFDDVSRFVDAGIPTAVNADFNEQSVLGRAEWLKLTALFLNAEADATRRFDEIAGAYDEVAQRAAQAGERPSAFANTPFEGTWFMPGGNSYFANAVDDAGGAYVFADDDSTGSLALDIETVLDRAGDADVWLQAGSVEGSLDDLRAIDERFEQFDAFQAGEVWAYDRGVTEGGGYPVLEIAYTRADLFLADLAKIFHPEEFADVDLTFFGQVPGDPAGG
jgi:iron complex transport system substrate-binding protein